MRGLLSFVYLIFAMDVVTIVVQCVQDEAQPHTHHRYAMSACNTNVAYDRILLKHVTLLSKYVFTGKVFDINRGNNGTRVFKVNIRRVLKGDLNDIGVTVKFGTSKALRFSHATVFVESASISCIPLCVQTYGIFLREQKREGGTLCLSLVIEPLVLTLRSIEIIETAVKGKIYL